jgi:hypothetical protein
MGVKRKRKYCPVDFSWGCTSDFRTILSILFFNLILAAVKSYSTQKVMKNKKEQLFTIKPSQVYFTHSKIRGTFTGCGRSVHETLDSLRKDSSYIHNIPRIKVVTDGEKYYSMNNRRLWVFKQLEKEGLLETVDVALEPIPAHSKIAKNTYSMEAKVCLK